MIVEDGTGLTNANSYLDPESPVGEALLDAVVFKVAWTAATTGLRETALQQATGILDDYEWLGSRKTLTQSLGWPRNEVVVDGVSQLLVPRLIQRATLELAIALLSKDRTNDVGEKPVEQIGLGDGAIDIKFSGDPVSKPVESIVPDYIRSYLRNLIKSGSGTSMRSTERR